MTEVIKIIALIGGLAIFFSLLWWGVKIWMKLMLRVREKTENDPLVRQIMKANARTRARYARDIQDEYDSLEDDEMDENEESDDAPTKKKSKSKR